MQSSPTRTKTKSAKRLTDSRVTPLGINAPKLCPALPWKWRWTVSSGSPCQCFLVISLPRMVPTARLTLQIGRVALVGLPYSIEVWGDAPVSPSNLYDLR
jgi:hypothetical protein